MIWLGKLLVVVFSFVVAILGIIPMAISFPFYLISISVVCRDDPEALKDRWMHYFCSWLPLIFFINTRWRVRTMQTELEMVKKLNKGSHGGGYASDPHFSWWEHSLKLLREYRPELFIDNIEQCNDGTLV